MNERTIFLTIARSPKEKMGARRLIDSIRTFGGTMGDCPIWVFEVNPQQTSCGDLSGNGIQIIPLSVPDTVRNYIFADKVYACAQAEAMAIPTIGTFVWIDPNCLVVNPPVLVDLGDTFDAAVRPVHIRNVGLLANNPLDDFWQTIYATVGTTDIQTTVVSFVDRQRIRAYFNSHVFAIHPQKGLLRRWFADFERLVCDKAFQASACADELHQIFLFQAVLSALLMTSLDWQRIRLLPPTYSYPYNLHARVPMEQRAQSINELVCFTYEDRSINPSAMTDIQIDAPFRAWLTSHPA
jgi:hypothetical protein